MAGMAAADDTGGSGRARRTPPDNGASAAKDASLLAPRVRHPQWHAAYCTVLYGVTTSNQEALRVHFRHR
jgi:hypothetical protein